MRKSLFCLAAFGLMVCLFATSSSGAEVSLIKMSEAEVASIGKKIWRNECGGTRDGLTSWNKGESFASLGIGHFIWYPEGVRGPFKESFPALRDFLKSEGVKMPRWLATAKYCPWPNRASFMADFRSPKMEELRNLLAATVTQQARFAALRLEQALPAMLDVAPTRDRERIRRNFYRVANVPGGLYALMDYVNFKGEGTSATERYKGEGWGLSQVLAAMSDEGSPLISFSKAADKVLTRRVANAPASRGEQKWLPGWRNRVATYAP